MATKHEVVKDVLEECLKASKEEKGKLLDRLEKTTKMHRGSIKRRLKVLQKRIDGYNWSEVSPFS